MKNNFEYYVDEINYFTYEGKSLILFRGWCFHSSQAPLSFHVKVNNDDVPFKVALMDRIDIVQGYLGQTNGINVGFYVSAVMDGDIHSAELSVSCHRDQTVLTHVNNRRLKSLLKEGPICYKAWIYRPDDNINKKTEVNGWAFALDGSVLEFGIEDHNHNLIESSLYLYDQKELFELGLVNEDSRICGFHTEFIEENEGPYYVTFYNDKHRLSIDVNDSSLAGDKVKWYRYFSEINGELITKGIQYLKDNGPKQFLKKVFKGEGPEAFDYNNWAKRRDATEAQLLEQSKHVFDYAPKMSFIVATFNTPVILLKDMIDSVVNQSYANWELCIADGSSTSTVLDYIHEHYQDERIKTVSLDKNYGIAGNMNEAIKLATGDFIGLYDHDDTVTPDALYEFVKVLNEHPDVKMIYSDEDKINSNGTLRFDPHFKSDFNPDLLRGNNYICHLLFVKADLVRELGGLRSEFDGAQDFDFVLRLMDMLKPEEIYHIPRVLYHWRIHENSTASNPESKRYAFDAGRKAIEAHHERNHVDATVEDLPVPGFYHSIYHLHSHPKVSILIPTMDHIDDLKRCIDSVEMKSTYNNYEIIVIENNSKNEETFAYYKELAETYSNIKIVYWKDEFNYSAINNYGASFASGEYYLLLNNDTEVIEPSWMEIMLGFCMRDDVGAVGAKLFYPDDTIQHGGVIIGIGGIAGHAFTNFSRKHEGYFGRLILSSDLNAVTAACMMVKASIYNQLGGLDPGYRVAFNDVDFCLRVREAGYLIVFAADCQLYHFESKSRGLENTPEKVKRFNAEIDRFSKRWGDILAHGDPYYNPNLTKVKNDFSLRED